MHGILTHEGAPCSAQSRAQKPTIIERHTELFPNHKKRRKKKKEGSTKPYISILHFILTQHSKSNHHHHHSQAWLSPLGMDDARLQCLLRLQAQLWTLFSPAPGNPNQHSTNWLSASCFDRPGAEMYLFTIKFCCFWYISNTSFYLD